MKYSLYQIQLSDEVISRIRSCGASRDSIPEYVAKTNSMFGDPNLGIKLNLYKKVAEIDANDLDDVFEIGNIGPEKKIKRIGPMHSVSVGDLIEDQNGQRVVVASFGFEPA